jgi:alkylated DNA nucleotide flippase Atl1
MTIRLLRRSGRPSRVTTYGEIASIIGESKQHLRSTIVETIVRNRHSVKTPR